MPLFFYQGILLVYTEQDHWWCLLVCLRHYGSSYARISIKSVTFQVFILKSEFTIGKWNRISAEGIWLYNTGGEALGASVPPQKNTTQRPENIVDVWGNSWRYYSFKRNLKWKWNSGHLMITSAEMMAAFERFKWKLSEGFYFYYLLLDLHVLWPTISLIFKACLLTGLLFLLHRCQHKPASCSRKNHPWQLRRQ